jgi:hypothetical protein
MSLSVIQLRNILDKLIKDDPKTAHLPVKLAQYDSEASVNEGEEPADDVDARATRVVIL